MSSQPVRVGSPHVWYFRWGYAELGGRWLEPVEGTQDAPGLLDHPWPEGAQVEVRISVFEADGVLFAGQVVVSTTPEPLDLTAQRYGVIPAPAVEPLPVGTDIWRMIPLGRLSREAVAFYGTAEAGEVAHSELADQPEVYERLSAAARALPTSSRGQVGRPSKLSPALLEFAAKAWGTGGTRGRQAAVQRFLQDVANRGLGFEGSGPDGQVTEDQAKKVIQAARRKGLLPSNTRGES